MKSFPLKIVTPDGLQFDAEAEELIVRTTSGDVGILAGHISCYMVGISYTYVWRCICLNVRYNVIVNTSVIRVESKSNLYVWI